MVIFKSRFKKELKDIFDYIALDSKNRAYDFKNTLLDKLQILENLQNSMMKILEILYIKAM